jgi:hypothetical protein
MPIGGTLPITPHLTSSRMSTRSIAPIAPRMPCLIWAPSRAGPAGAEQAISRRREPMTTSPLVPMSTATRTSGLS